MSFSFRDLRGSTCHSSAPPTQVSASGVSGPSGRFWRHFAWLVRPTEIGKRGQGNCSLNRRIDPFARAAGKCRPGPAHANQSRIALAQDRLDRRPLAEHQRPYQAVSQLNPRIRSQTVVVRRGLISWRRRLGPRVGHRAIAGAVHHAATDAAAGHHRSEKRAPMVAAVTARDGAATAADVLADARGPPHRRVRMSRGLPRPTQDSLPAAGQALPDGLFTRKVPLKGFRSASYISSSLPKFPWRNRCHRRGQGWASCMVDIQTNRIAEGDKPAD